MHKQKFPGFRITLQGRICYKSFGLLHVEHGINCIRWKAVPAALLFIQHLFSSLSWGTGSREFPDVRSFLPFLTLVSKLLSVFLQVIYFLGHANNRNRERMCENVRCEHSIYTTRFPPTTKSFSSEQSLRVFFYLLKSPIH